jgi:hypothetical protein
MSKYTERMQPLWDQLKPFVKDRNEHHKVVVFNNNLMKSNRRGDYLIKQIDKAEIDTWSNKYIHYSYRDDGWVVCCSRDDAQWFSLEEAREIIQKFPGYKIVKK